MLQTIVKTIETIGHVIHAAEPILLKLALFAVFIAEVVRFVLSAVMPEASH